MEPPPELLPLIDTLSASVTAIFPLVVLVIERFATAVSKPSALPIPAAAEIVAVVPIILFDVPLLSLSAPAERLSVTLPVPALMRFKAKPLVSLMLMSALVVVAVSVLTLVSMSEMPPGAVRVRPFATTLLAAPLLSVSAPAERFRVTLPVPASIRFNAKPLLSLILMSAFVVVAVSVLTLVSISVIPPGAVIFRPDATILFAVPLLSVSAPAERFRVTLPEPASMRLRLRPLGSLMLMLVLLAVADRVLTLVSRALFTPTPLSVVIVKSFAVTLVRTAASPTIAPAGAVSATLPEVDRYPAAPNVMSPPVTSARFLPPWFSPASTVIDPVVAVPICRVPVVLT